jgi:hypothetical protein
MIEAFQNEVIRPIIKSKNDFFIAYFLSHKQAKLILNQKLSDQQSSIEKLLKSDLSLKNIYIGAVISNFSETDLTFFLGNKAEFSKRIINIIAKRIFDNS